MPPPGPFEQYTLKRTPIKQGFPQMANGLNFFSKMCYALYSKNELIHVSYLYTNVFINYLFGYKGYLVIGDCFTKSEYRGKGLYPKMLKFIANENNKNIVIYVSATNNDSIKGIEKAGFQIEKKLIIYKLYRLPIYWKQIPFNSLY